MVLGIDLVLDLSIEHDIFEVEDEVLEVVDEDLDIDLVDLDIEYVIEYVEVLVLVVEDLVFEVITRSLSSRSMSLRFSFSPSSTWSSRTQAPCHRSLVRPRVPRLRRCPHTREIVVDIVLVLEAIVIEYVVITLHHTTDLSLWIITL